MAHQADVSNLGFKLTIYSIVAGVALTFGTAYVSGFGYFFSMGNFLTSVFDFSLWMILNYIAFVIFIIITNLLAVSIKTLVVLFIIDCALVFLFTKIYPDGHEIVIAFYTAGIISSSYYAVVRRRIPAPKVE